MMVIGTLSGKEFVVEDKNFVLTNNATGDVKHVFLAKDRLITIKAEDIEYWNETLTPERLERLETMLKEQPPVNPNTHGVDVA